MIQNKFPNIYKYSLGAWNNDFLGVGVRGYRFQFSKQQHPHIRHDAEMASHINLKEY